MALLAHFTVKDSGCLGLLAHGFAQHNLRIARAGADAVFALHALQQNVQMQLAHAGNHAGACVVIQPRQQGGVFFRIARQRFVQNLAFVRIAGFQRKGDDGRVGIYAFQRKLSLAGSIGFPVCPRRPTTTTISPASAHSTCSRLSAWGR